MITFLQAAPGNSCARLHPDGHDIKRLVFVSGPGIVYATGAGFFSGLTMGTCLAALMFYIVGRRLWEIGTNTGLLLRESF